MATQWTGEGIREGLERLCTEDEFRSMRCPRCGEALSLSVSPSRTTAAVTCSRNPRHLFLHASVKAGPDWWTPHVSKGTDWIRSPKGEGEPRRRLDHREALEVCRRSFDERHDRSSLPARLLRCMVTSWVRTDAGDYLVSYSVTPKSAPHDAYPIWEVLVDQLTGASRVQHDLVAETALQSEEFMDDADAREYVESNHLPAVDLAITSSPLYVLPPAEAAERHLRSVFPGEPIRRPYESPRSRLRCTHLQFIDVPERGVVTHASVGFSTLRMPYPNHRADDRAEYLLASSAAAANAVGPAFLELLTTIVERSTLLVVGDIVDSVFAFAATPHALVAPPYFWQQRGCALGRLPIRAGAISWFMIVPITAAEREYARASSGVALLDRLRTANADIVDVNRSSVVG